jgi:hypothetical protein
MNININVFRCAFVSILLALIACSSTSAQNKSTVTVLTGPALTKVVPTSFYFAGQSAQTQMRNAAAVQFGENRFAIAGLVDTSGYSTEISGKYEGFFITDSPVKIGGKRLDTGAYGFGFSANGEIRIFDLSSKEVLSARTQNDSNMKRPRPLAMAAEGKTGVRLYKGKTYVVISPE